jgi:hypothetical protein
MGESGRRYPQLVESTLPGQQSSSTKPGDGADKPAQTGKPVSNDHLLQPYLSQSIDSASNSSTKNGLAQLSKTPTDWTIVGDMSILFDSQGANGHMGAENKTALLKQLKDQTKDHSVSIVLQSVSVDGKDVKPGFDLSTSQEPYQVKTIVLRDGQEYDISSGKSQGLKADLQNELDFALKNQPSQHVALAISAHGLGDEGILGGTQENNNRVNGRMKTADELADTIKSSLTKANHGKLDVVDMDSCMMAQMGVLHSMSGVADQLVASEQTEKVSADHGVDGQNLNAWVSKVIGNSKMSGADVAREIVAEANNNQNNGDAHGPAGTATLAAFDLSHVDEFSGLMNKLGKALSDTSKTPGGANAISGAIDDTENFDAAQQYGPPVVAADAKYDVKDFLGRLKFRLGASSNDELTKAMDDVNHYVDDRSKLITAVHLPYGYAQNDLMHRMPAVPQGTGLSIYLPNKDIRQNASKTKADIDNLGTMETGTTDSDWNTFLSSMWKPAQSFGLKVTRIQ